MNNQALLIGINDYPSGSGLSPLQCAERDASELGKVLRQCGFAVDLLLGAAATRDAIEQALYAVKDSRNFLFFFAGHGQLLNGASYRLHPYDSVAHGPRSYPFSDIVSIWKSATGFQNVLAILDTCRSQGVMTGGGGVRKAEPLSEKSMRDIRAQISDVDERWIEVLYGCDEGQYSYEDTDQLGHGLLTAGLLHAFHKSGRLDSQMLAGRACDWMRAWCRNDPEGRRQQALRYGPASETAPFVLRGGGGVTIASPARLHITTQPSGASVTIDGRGYGGSPVRVELSGGTHTVRVEKDGYRTWERRIEFDGQGDADLPVTLEALPKGPQAGEVKTFADIEMVWVPPGSFMMGSPEDEEERFSDEGPQHRVTISRGFWLGKYEVTQAQWHAVMGNNPSNFTGDGRLPVEQVSWDDCQSFIRKLNQQGAGTFRLPTEAEWEYACRAGTTTPFYFGNTISMDQANYDGETTPVGSFPGNAWGLHDMHGNVWEWCEDDWHDDYAGAPTDGRAWVDSPRGSSRVIRGGSWDFTPRGCRSAARGRSAPGHRGNVLGFRLALPAVQ